MDAMDGKPVAGVQIYEKNGKLLDTSLPDGSFNIAVEQPEITLVFFSYDYSILELELSDYTQELNIKLEPLAETLNAVEIIVRKKQIFKLKRLKDVEGTALYAGKKTEVVLLEDRNAAIATNNARQIFAQVAGLNIYQNDDAGLQLNIGGRGLDPNRTSNFNTRQNGYDISADVLGYPESYYTPAAEGLQEIQLVRGAASLQYGTQFGGYVNFVTKEPVRDKRLELVTRNTVGSYGLFTNFTSASGTVGKFSYYTYFNYKQGDGFRDNSGLSSRNFFAQIGYQLTDRTKVTGELTIMDYLSQQAGGLNDVQFDVDSFQSNRERNWFDVNWNLYSLRLDHEMNNGYNFSLNLFGLDATRDALGFRTNRVDQPDPGGARELISGVFQNYGLEARLVGTYQIFEKEATFLLGSKIYEANNRSAQGPASDGAGPDFQFDFDQFSSFPVQNDFEFPNFNASLFGENIFYLNDKLSITPGFRLEHIKTESDGFFRDLSFDGAGNVIRDRRIDESRTNERTFVLAGLGVSYKWKESIEWYGNLSLNYRSVTFTDISTVNPAFAIDPQLGDERGFTLDLGARGNYENLVSYEATLFGLYYNDRIGFVQSVLPDNRIVSLRTNVGDARLLGAELLIDFNLAGLLRWSDDYILNVFINSATIYGSYTSSQQDEIEGNEVEFVPRGNYKTGINLGYKNFSLGVQFSYVSSQFTDATNAQTSNLSGVIGEIPAYHVLDVNASYRYGRFKLEAGVNNALDNKYFTRRATGYPGPGIIPSAPINFYTTLEIKL